MATGEKQRWFDPKITWQNVLTAMVTACGTVAVINSSFAGLSERITKVEQHDAAQDQRFAQVEKSADQNKTDVKEQLGSIAGDVKDIRKYLMDRQQPAALGRWTK